MNIIEAIDTHFSRWFAGDSWRRRKVLLKAKYALPMDSEDLAIFQHHTGRTNPPVIPPREVHEVKSRRTGGSLMLSAEMTYRGCFIDYSQILQPGEAGTILVMATDKKQARVIFRYIKGFLSVPALRPLVQNETQETLELLVNGCTILIEIHAASWRSVRGVTLLAAACDEVSYWRSEESANPDIEVLRALRPAMATVPNAQLSCISTPYSRRGVLWEAYSKYFGKENSEVLVWRGTASEMNPTLSQSVIDAALAEDELAARSEYLAEFRSDIESFIDREVLRQLVVPARQVLPYSDGLRYYAFVDPAGGSGGDSMTLAISHCDHTRKVVLDCLLERRPPFSPEQVVAEFCETLRAYRISRVTGDRYAGDWPAEQFRKRGVLYQASELSKSELYVECLPLLNAGAVELPDSSRLIAQFAGLERRTGRGTGRDIVDHPPGQFHDDLSNAAAGAIVLARPDQRRKIARALGGVDAQGNYVNFREPVADYSRREARVEVHRHNVFSNGGDRGGGGTGGLL